MAQIALRQDTISAANASKEIRKEAAGAVCDGAFENAPFNVRYTFVKADNLASEETANSIGMHKSGEYVDSEQELTSFYTLER